LVVAAEKATVLGFQDAPPLSERLGGVIGLDAAGGAANAAIVRRPLALPLIPLPDRAADLSGDVAGAGLGCRGSRRRGRGDGGRLLPRALHEAAAFGVPLDDEVEPDLEDRVAARARMRVREGGAGLLELVEEAP